MAGGRTITGELDDSGVNELAVNSSVANADQAMLILKNIKREFAPLLRQRGWQVQHLQEMCCCANGGGVKRNSNTLGVCHGGVQGKMTPRIELRLRRPKSHDFLDYESDIVGTMCHELAHIVHGKHSSEFYKLMDELQDQFDATRSKAGVDGRGTFAGASLNLNPERHNPIHKDEARRLAAAAAAARLRHQRLMGAPGGSRLGGGTPDWKKLSPRELAARAAERRLRDDQWCSGTVFSDGHGIESSENEFQSKQKTGPKDQIVSPHVVSPPTTFTPEMSPTVAPASQPPPDRYVPSKRPRDVFAEAVDLTEDCRPGCRCCSGPPAGLNGIVWSCLVCTLQNASTMTVCSACGTRRARMPASPVLPALSGDNWSCSVCTLLNPAPALRCSVCDTPRSSVAKC